MTRGRRRWLTGAAVVLGGSAVVAAAILTLTPSTDDTSAAVAAASGVILTGTGTTRLELPTVDPDAIHVVATFGCDSVGDFSWGPLDARPVTSECARVTLGTASRFTTFDFSLAAPARVFVVTADADDRWSLTLRFLPDRGRVDGVNAAGQSFGVPGVGGPQPDLVLVPMIDGRGETVSGYARAVELRPPIAGSEAETLRAEIDRDAAYPDGRPVEVYRSDGTTVLGSFVVQGG